MAIVGIPRTFDKKFSFQIQLDGFGSTGFSKCSELSVEIGEVTHREGGGLLPDKSAGLPTFKDITLERGATRDLDMFVWLSEVITGAANRGLKDPFYKRNGSILQLDRDGGIRKIWTLFGAWPKGYKAGEWDASAEEVVIESLTIAYDFFERTL